MEIIFLLLVLQQLEKREKKSFEASNLFGLLVKQRESKEDSVFFFFLSFLQFYFL
jgi:hypothetical protein